MQNKSLIPTHHHAEGYHRHARQTKPIGIKGNKTTGPSATNNKR
jgi:hypothetical protein